MWEPESKPGTSWTAGQLDITAGMESYKGYTVYMGTIGLLDWHNEEK